MTMPNFLIVGAAKAGTTAIWQYVRQHPQVYMSPRKHPKFFAFEGESPNFSGPPPRNLSSPWAVTDLDAYRALFRGVSTESAIGEASHSYLYFPEAPLRIRRHVPEAKIIAVLRNPADRAYSHFLNLARDGREPLADFTQALEAEDARIRDNWWPEFHYAHMGFYYTQLKRYFDLFARDQLKIYLYDDLISDPLLVMRDIYKFLGVDDQFVPDVRTKYKVSGLPTNRAVYTLFTGMEMARPAVERLIPEQPYRLLHRITVGLKNRTLYKPEFPGEARSVLVEAYRPDVLKLQSLIGRDLSHWLK